jgi:uncharacterized protein DUF6576
VGSVVLGIMGLITNYLLLVFIAISCAHACFQMRMMLREAGPDGMSDFDDYSASFRSSSMDRPRTRRLSRRSIKKAQKRAAAEQAEQARIDEILDKVSAHGMQSLTWWEKRTLRKATERQRQRDLEVSRMND